MNDQKTKPKASKSPQEMLVMQPDVELPGWDELIAQEEKEDALRKQILEKCKNLMSADNYEDMLFSIEESDYTYDYKFVDKPVGEYDKDENYWVNQTKNGGYTGDEFAGTLCFKIKDRMYLKMNYSM